ncbi:MAG: HlyD family efflux transporter periplasmic adaptor subunit [Lewinellaceae bacterium]|nr:HlyD family efflux transporter periplasmic adaptor subunit [Lewinellaceae bacterium]
MKKEKLEINRFEELIGPMPDGVLRRWSWILLALLSLFLGFSILLKVSEKLSAPITITTFNPPVQVKAPANGMLREILINNLDTVRKKQILARQETEVSLEELERLQSLFPSITQYQANPDPILLKLNLVKDIEGEIAVQIEGIIQNLNKYHEVLRDPLYLDKKNILESKLKYHAQLHVLLKQELASKKREVALEQNQFTISQSLYDSGVIAKVQFLEAQRQLLSTEASLQTQQREIEKNNLELTEVENQISTLQLDYQQDLKTAMDKLDDRILGLQTSLHGLEHAYQIESPAAGVLEFVDIFDQGQYLVAGDLLFNITPFDNRIIGQMALSEANTADLRIGQSVRIKLNKYPFQEWGILEGVIQSVTSVPIEGQYRIRIDLPHGLQTSFSKKLPYVNQLEGKAEIILDKKPFLQKIFQRLLSAWQENTR